MSGAYDLSRIMRVITAGRGFIVRPTEMGKKGRCIALNRVSEPVGIGKHDEMGLRNRLYGVLTVEAYIYLSEKKGIFLWAGILYVGFFTI